MLCVYKRAKNKAYCSDLKPSFFCIFHKCITQTEKHFNSSHPVVYLIFNKMFYSVFTQFQYISFLATCTHYCSGDKIENNEMDGACSTYGGEEGRIQGFDGET